MSRSTFVYVSYINTTLEKLWSALTEDSEFMKQYWFGVHCQSGWRVGSSWKMVSSDGSSIIAMGEIAEIEPLKRLVIRWEDQQRPEYKAEGVSLCTIELEPFNNAIKLSITHSMACESSKLIEGVSGGWPKIISNLKSLIEAGAAIIGQPYLPQSTDKKS